MDEPQLLHQARAALEQAVHFSFDCQRPDGHWVAEVSADATFTSEYVMFKYAIGLDLKPDGDAIRRWLLQDQQKDGSWTIGPEVAGNVSTTTEAYLALKILGMPPDDPSMLRARDFMIRSGGVAKVRFFTRFFLASFGLFPWESIPQLPAEMILMPPASPLNIYTLSSWARSTLVPILIVHHHKPIYALPNGLSSNNDFLDELWVDATNKNVPFAPPLSELFSDRAWIEFGFTAIDKIIAQMGGLRNNPLRKISRKRCVEWILEHQEDAGEWAGFFSATHGSLWALLLEGYSPDDKVIRSGLDALERLACDDERGRSISVTLSPVWDTALMAGALCDAGLPDDPRVQQAAAWVKRKQIYGPQGDWRVYSVSQVAGGWSFEYENTFYPDVDDTAVVIITLVKQDPQLASSQSIADAVLWILGMQNYNGGWAAFDTNNESLWLHKIPFSDMDSLCDPASADITGRILECFGFLLAGGKNARLDAGLESKVVEASRRGLLFIIEKQEASGSWWGRWGNNYIFGTSNVLRGLVNFARGSPEVKAVVARALKWIESVQNPDGGWGESLNSYDSPQLAGRGGSTGAQTAWALEALLPYCPVSSKTIQNGIKWLVDYQSVRSKHGASWPTDIYTGIGFPNVLYLGYPLYHHAFPVRALSQYVKGIGREGFQPIKLPSTILERLGRPDVLVMASGSREDIQPFLHIASILESHYNCRLRVASHLTHQKAIQQEDFEFYEIAGSPEVFAKAFTEWSDLLKSFIRGNFGRRFSTIKLMLADCLRSTIDNKPSLLGDKLKSDRPFLADVVTSHLPILAHIHAAEVLQVPLVLVSTQPDIHTSGFPHTLLKNQITSWLLSWWNYATYFLSELFNWIVFGPFLEDYRCRVYKTSSRPLGWYIDYYNRTLAPHVCLWSPHVVPRQAERNHASTVGGYAFSDQCHKYIPSQELEHFLTAEQPVIAVSFDYMKVSDPEKLLSMLSRALTNVGAKAVVTRFWTKGDLNTQDGQHIYVLDDVPNDWLLQHVQGSVHHGGAGHTATGLRAGVPALMFPFCPDQNFWAAQAHSLGTGPLPVPFKDITVQSLTKGLSDLLSGKYQERGAQIAAKISLDHNGAQVAAELIALQTRPTETTEYCCLLPGLKSQWRHAESQLPLSGVAVVSLVSQGLLSWSDVDYLPAYRWSDPTVKITRQARLFVLFLSCIGSFFQYVYWLLVGAAPVGKNAATDPVHEARVNQSLYDLNFVKGQEGNDFDGNDLDRRLAQNWETLIEKEFQQSFEISA